MDGQFTIDDVRDSFSRDMKSRLQAAQRACSPLEQNIHALCGAVSEAPENPHPFQQLEELHHSIYGTSSLVSANGLARGSKLLEVVAGAGLRRARALQRELESLQALAQFCTNGSKTLETMLDLELAHDGQNSQERATDLILAVSPLLPLLDAEALQRAQTAGVLPYNSLPLPVQSPQPVAPEAEAFKFESKDAPEVPASASEFSFAPAGETSAADFSFDDTASQAAMRKVEVPEASTGLDAPELLDVFRSEVRESLAGLETLLHKLTAAPNDRIVAEATARIYHTIKGAAASVGLSGVSKSAAQLEEDLERVSEQRTTASPAFLDDVLARTNTLLNAAGLPALTIHLERAAVPAAQISETTPPRETVSQADSSYDKVIWDAFVEETTDLLDTLARKLVALEDEPNPLRQAPELMRAYHTLKGALFTAGQERAGRAVHEIEDLFERAAEDGKLPPLDALVPQLMRQAQALRDAIGRGPDAVAALPAGQLEVDASSATTPATEAVKTTEDDQESSAAEPAETIDAAHIEHRFVRVAAERLDGLMNLAGELVVGRAKLTRQTHQLRTLQNELAASRARLQRTVGEFRERYEFTLLRNRQDNVRLYNSSGERALTVGTFSSMSFSELEMDQYDEFNILARSLTEVCDDISEIQQQFTTGVSAFSDESDAFNQMVAGLRTEVMQSRMVPVQPLFMRLRFAARDAADREQKQIRVTTSGEDVSLDKTIVDALYVPLLHVVRNGVSHGIESTDVRQQKGKPPVGTVTLSARQSAGQVVIGIQDDGSGLNRAALHARGVERGLIGADVSPDDPRVAELIFVSGFSTRQDVGDVSGRGMGCAVLRDEIAKLGGTVGVTSRPGEGTLFTITLPLTLAISRALLIKQGGRPYAIPLSSVIRVLDGSEQDISISDDGAALSVGGNRMDLTRLSDVFGQASPQPGARQRLVVLRAGDTDIAVHVDDVLGQDEIVVKRLGALLQAHPLFTGCTPAPDGSPILVLDVQRLITVTRTVRAAPEIRSAAGQPVAKSGARRAAVRVLFADDSLSVRKVAERYMSELNCELTLAVDGVDALAKLRRGQYDIVFTDLEMPRRNGYELIRELRYAPRFQAIPIVVVTSRSGAKHRARAEMLGASDYLTKPFTVDQIRNAIQEHVLRNQQPASVVLTPD